MSDESPGRSEPYAYPADLARLVHQHWTEAGETREAETAPSAATLEAFFAPCYQASLLREEERPVTFRAILAAPSLFARDGRPPESVQRLEFASPLPFDGAELRRLSVATDAHRTLIGVDRDGQGGWQIWGLVSSGTRWLRDVEGGRRAAAPLPPVPVVHVDGPGSVAAHQGTRLVATLLRGRLSGLRADPFASQWLPQQFLGLRDQLMARHLAAAAQARAGGEVWADVEPTLPRRISERMMKRVIALLREARHGGTIVFVPAAQVAELTGGEPSLDIKYRFTAGLPQRSFPALVVDLLNRLAQVAGGAAAPPRGVVGWHEFEAATDDALATLDESLFEVAHLIAGLASADGAVVMTKEQDLVGFGGMITGRLPAVRRVARALDLEGDHVAHEDVGGVGARHRSAYRLSAGVPESVVIVVSQDGGVRFVAQKDGRVTYWEQD